MRAAGTRVKTDASSEGRYVDTFLEEPYATRLSGLLQFGDFETAEKSLRNLDAAHREYLAASDNSGVRLVRTLALKGKLRAQSLAANLTNFLNRSRHRGGIPTVDRHAGALPSASQRDRSPNSSRRARDERNLIR